ncbi:MAG: hypothetical protein AB1665_00690 [Candidatus Thermoplasmatota archaeon]
MRMNNDFGRLLYAPNKYREPHEAKKHAMRLFRTVFFLTLGLYLFLIILDIINGFNFESSLSFYFVLLLGFSVIWVMLFVWYLVFQKTNWSAIFEKGIAPPMIPLKYAKEGKRFIPYQEIERITIKRDEVVDYYGKKHCWHFVFHLKDGVQVDMFRSSLMTHDTEENIEREYQILKYIMDHLDEKVEFTAEEIGVQPMSEDFYRDFVTDKEEC